MARMLVHDAFNRLHVNRGGGKACPCCTPVHSKNAKKNRRMVTRQQRAVEKDQWKKEQW